MGLHYTVNNSTSKKFLALASSFWRGLRNFGYVFAIFCTRQLVSKNVLHYDGGVRTRTVAVLVLLFSTSSAMYCTSSLV
jgi:hypothetical protein